MKLDFNKKFKDLAGKEMQGEKMGEYVANLLAAEKQGDSIKFYGWAVKLFAGEKIDLDKSDQIKLKEILKREGVIPALLKAQILEEFDSGTNDK